jgi:hypothetical protein
MLGAFGPLCQLCSFCACASFKKEVVVRCWVGSGALISWLALDQLVNVALLLATTPPGPANHSVSCLERQKAQHLPPKDRAIARTLALARKSKPCRAHDQGAALAGRRSWMLRRRLLSGENFRHLDPKRPRYFCLRTFDQRAPADYAQR